MKNDGCVAAQHNKKKFEKEGSLHCKKKRKEEGFPL
jgi:hypothetical protein